MRFIQLLWCALLLALVPLAPAQAAGPCDGTDGDAQAILECHVTQSDHAIEDGQATSPGETATYEYTWLPACPAAFPGSVGSAGLNCLAERTCADPNLTRQTLWARQLTNAAGQRVQEPWRAVDSECRDAAEVGPVRERTLTWQTVLGAIRRVGVPASEVHAPAYTLVNLETTFWTTADEVERSLTLVGFDVDVRVRPTAYHWHWGDGRSTTTRTPGRPYPADDVTHTFVHATRNGPPVRLSVDTTYSAEYRVDGGGWQRIPEQLTIPGSATSMPVREATAVLVATD